MPENNPTPQPAAPAAKPRNPVEKLLVRGFIAAALVLIAVEANSWWQQQAAMKVLLPKLKLIESDSSAPAVTEADVKAALGGKQPNKDKSDPNLNPATSHYGASRLDVYSWFTISPVNKREIYVYYGRVGPHDKDGPEVLSIQGDDAAPPAKELPPHTASGGQPNPAAGGAGMMGGGGGPRGAGGRPQSGPGPGHDPDAGKPAGNKPETDKPADEKPDDAKPGDADGDKESK